MEREQKIWEKIEAQIMCPRRPGELCRKSEGIKRVRKTVSNTAILFTAECKSCGSQTFEWE